MDYLYLGKLKQEIAAVFQRQYPDAPRIVDPVQQLRTRMEEAKKFSTGAARSGANFLDMLREISGLVPAGTPFLITAISLDGAKIEVKAETASLDAVEAVKRELGRSRLFREVAVHSANQMKDRNKVEFELRMSCEE
jgi:Tfp pilus assembly protein PilN